MAIGRRLGDHDGDDIADEPHGVTRQRPAVVGVAGEQLGEGGEEHRAEVEVVVGEHDQHTVEREGGGGVDPRDPSVGHRRPHEGRVGQPVDVDVRRVLWRDP